YETLYNQWNTPENATFSYIRTDKDLRSLIACDILLGEHPDLAVVPNLTAIVEEWLQLDGKRDQAAKERTVTLAFREFRWNNGINANLTKASIKDIKNLIDDSLSEVEKSVAIS